MSEGKSKERGDSFLLQTHQGQSSLLKGTTGYPPLSLSRETKYKKKSMVSFHKLRITFRSP